MERLGYTAAWGVFVASATRDSVADLPAPHVWARVGLACLVVLGAWLRLRAIGHGLTPEEVSDVEHGSLGYYLSGAEVGVNPPLLRVALNLLLECRDTLIAGRILSLACGLLTPLWLFAVARRASRGSDVAGLFAAAMAAVLPMAVETGTEFRAYAPALACTAAMLAAAGAVLDTPEDASRRGSVVGFTGLAVLLPQLHYMGVPLLLGLGAALLTVRAARPLLAGLVVSGLVFLPIAVVAWGQSESRATEGGDVREGLLAVGSLDLSLPGDWLDWMIDSGLVSGWHDAERAGLAGFVIMALSIAALCWRRLGGLQRGLIGASVGVLGGTAIFATAHHVRSPVAVILLSAVAPLVASLPSVFPRRWRPVMSALLFPPLLVGVVDKWSRAEAPTDPMGWFDHHVRDFDAVRGDAPVWLMPRISHTTLHFYLVGHSWGPHAPATACEGDTDCFELRGVRFRSDDCGRGRGQKRWWCRWMRRGRGMAEGVSGCGRGRRRCGGVRGCSDRRVAARPQRPRPRRVGCGGRVSARVGGRHGMTPRTTSAGPSLLLAATLSFRQFSP